jgi:hypothetical protein
MAAATTLRFFPISMITRSLSVMPTMMKALPDRFGQELGAAALLAVE